MWHPVLSELEIPGQVKDCALHPVVETLSFAVTGRLQVLVVVTPVRVHQVMVVMQMAIVHLVDVMKRAVRVDPVTQVPVILFFAWVRTRQRKNPLANKGTGILFCQYCDGERYPSRTGDRMYSLVMTIPESGTGGPAPRAGNFSRASAGKNRSRWSRPGNFSCRTV